ncbi:hypothetical protein ACG74X_19840 [Marivita sp. S0852]|uniref:hypothetical protein n=1 Tax=Marivita sp. S0852 TaxID=3373893 RepID=UPI003982723A
MAETFLRDILKKYPISDKEYQTGIMDYIENGELEIAFEGAFLWYVKNKIEFSKKEKDKILACGHALDLDKARVVDDTSWQQFVAAFS